MAKNSVFQRATRDKVSLIFLVEELDWHVALKVDDASIFETKVEILLLSAAKALKHQVFCELSRLISSLKQGMLTIERHIPCNYVELMSFVINHIELEQSLIRCLVDVLKPDILAEV